MAPNMRIAVRDEGSHIAAYLAKSNTMEGAVLLASLSKTLALVPGVLDEWRGLVVRAFQTGMAIAEQPVEVDAAGNKPPAHETRRH